MAEEVPLKTEEISLKKTVKYLGIFVLLVIGVFYLKGQLINSNGLTGAVAGVGSYDSQQVDEFVAAKLENGVQVIDLSIKGGNYYPNTIKLKKGIPVAFNVDTDSVQGCYRGIKIPSFNIKKVVTPADNKVEFTPDKAGTFGFSCFMGMGRGKLVIEDETGAIPSTIDALAAAPKGSGGCGCGGGSSCGI